MKSNITQINLEKGITFLIQSYAILFYEQQFLKDFELRVTSIQISKTVIIYTPNTAIMLSYITEKREQNEAK